MSNGELHEVSLEIGKLVYGLQAMKAEVAAFRKEFMHHNEKLEAKVNGLLELKHKGAGLLLGVSLVAGTIGSAITVALQYFKGQWT